MPNPDTQASERMAFEAWAPPTGSNKSCTVHGCNAPHVARGYCHKHYKRWARTGKTDDPLRAEKMARTYYLNKGQTCFAPACSRPATSKGLCKHHYDAARYRVALRSV